MYLFKLKDATQMFANGNSTPPPFTSKSTKLRLSAVCSQFYYYRALNDILAGCR